MQSEITIWIIYRSDFWLFVPITVPPKGTRGGHAKCPAILKRAVSTRGVARNWPYSLLPPEEREHFLSLESAWISFAAELESAEAFLKTMDEIDFKQPYPLEAA